MSTCDREVILVALRRRDMRTSRRSGLIVQSSENIYGLDNQVVIQESIYIISHFKLIALFRVSHPCSTNRPRVGFCK